MEGKEYFRMGQRALVIGDLERSARMFDKALEKDFKPVRTLLSRGTVYLMVGDLQHALRDFSEVLSIDGENERAFYFRGITFLRIRQYSQATADLNDALSRNPERSAAYFARGVARSMLGGADEAAVDFEQAVALAGCQTDHIINVYGKDRELFSRFMQTGWTVCSPIFTESEKAAIRSWT